MEASESVKTLIPDDTAEDLEIQKITDLCYDAMNDDFNTPVVIANLFEAVRIVNSVNDGHSKINSRDLESLKNCSMSLFSRYLVL